jgi:cell division protein FtsB
MRFLRDKDLRIGKIDFNRLKNKYIITTLIFLVWIAFFDENNWVERAQNLRELRELRNDKEYYIEQIETDTERLKELKTNDENLEKYAREQYLMKKEDEVIFVVVEE